MPRHETADMRPHVEAVNPMQLGYQTTVPARVGDIRGGAGHASQQMAVSPHLGAVLKPSLVRQGADRHSDDVAAETPPHQIASGFVL